MSASSRASDLREAIAVVEKSPLVRAEPVVDLLIAAKAVLADAESLTSTIVETHQKAMLRAIEGEPFTSVLADLTDLREGLLASSRAAKTKDTRDRLTHQAQGIAMAVETLQRAKP